MSNGDQMSVEVALKPNDVCHPFIWSWANLWRWILAIVLCRVVYDVFFAPRVSLEAMPDADAIRLVILVLTLFIVLRLLLFPYFGFSPCSRRLLRDSAGNDAAGNS
jgi:hypothetical protein